MAFADLESKLDEARQGSGNDGSSGSTDYEDYPRVKLTPTAAIGGTIVDIGFTGDPYEEQNYRGGEGYGGDFVFTLEDPEVVQGQLFEALGRTDAEDNLVRNLDGESYYPFDVDRYTGGPTSSFRVVDAQGSDASHISEMVKKLDGDYDQVGVAPFGTEYPAQPTTFDDALDEYDRVEVFVGSQAGRMMMQSLDVSQGTSAYIRDDGSKTGGLIEFPRNYRGDGWSADEGPHPRVARITGPQLHPELEGEPIVLFKHFGDALTDDDEEDADDDDESSDRYRKHYGDVLWDDGDGGVILTQEDALDPALDDIEDTEQWLEFHEPDGGWGDDDGGAGADGDDTGGSTFDFDELDEGGDDETADDDGGLTMSELDKNTYGFVQEARAYAEQSGGIDEAFGSWESTVQSAIDGGEIEAYDPAELRTLVEADL